MKSRRAPSKTCEWITEIKPGGVLVSCGQPSTAATIRTGVAYCDRAPRRSQ